MTANPTPPDKELETQQPQPKATKPRYMFDWCAKCKYLGNCYYQHGEFKGPMFLEPACGEGPA